MNLAGLLPGVEAVRLGTCDATEFAQIGDQVFKAPAGQQVIVKPAPGYDFKFSITENCYRPVRTLAAKRTFTVCVECGTQEDIDHLDSVKRLPGVVSVTETTAVENS